MRQCGRHLVCDHVLLRQEETTDNALRGVAETVQHHFHGLQSVFRLIRQHSRKKPDFGSALMHLHSLLLLLEERERLLGPVHHDEHRGLHADSCGVVLHASRLDVLEATHHSASSPQRLLRHDLGVLRQREDKGALVEKDSLLRELLFALRDALRQHRARSGVLELAQMVSDYPSPRHAASTQLEVHRALFAALAENQSLVELDGCLPFTPRHTAHDRLRLGERLHAALAVEVDEVHVFVFHARCRGRLGERLALL